MDTERLRIALALPVSKGAHANLADGACIMELASYVAGEAWSDAPVCVSPCIAAFLRHWNDDLADTDRHILLPLLPTILHTVAPEKEDLRVYMILDWMVRVALPSWLALSDGLSGWAMALRDAARITSAQTLQQISPILFSARAAAQEAIEGATAQAAWDAAARAAWDAAARAAWRAAGGTAWGTAWDAAARAAWQLLQPTISFLQASALDLVKRLAYA